MSSVEVTLEHSGPLNQYYWCPDKKGKFGYRHTHREDAT